MTHLVSAEELNDHLSGGTSVTLIAAFWAPEGGGRRKFVSEHIPTSVFCDPTFALCGVPDFTVGRNPLPDPQRLQDWLQACGIDEDSHVVVYDEGRGLMAARTWWTFRWAGVERVDILDGGLRRWLKLGLPHIAGPGTLPGAGSFVVRPGAMPVLDLEQVRTFDGTLVDAREENRFTGRRELLDLRAGHIPGAVNVPVRSLLNADNTFRGADELREIFAAAGIADAADAAGACVYSGSGNHSAQLLAGMELAGLPGAAHYVGGWSQWSHRDLPVEAAV